MVLIWDFDPKVLKKSKSPWAKALLLERKINYGVAKREKIKLAEVKKYWHKINLFPLKRRLFEFLIWGK